MARLPGPRAASLFDLHIRLRCVRSVLLCTVEEREKLFVRPAFAVVLFAPLVIVGRGTVMIHHGVDGRRATNELSTRPLHLLVEHGGLRCGGVVPVSLRLEVLGENKGSLDLESVIVAACFENKYRGIGVLGETARQNAACRTGATDDEIVAFCLLGLLHGLRSQVGSSSIRRSVRE